MAIMDIDQIMQYLPQRPPFLLIDKVIEINEGQSLVAIKNVTMNEPFFVGHFPGRPVMPGVIMLEAMAQASGVLAYKSMDGQLPPGYKFLFAGIDNVRFKRMVIPGDQLQIEVHITKRKHDFLKASSRATVDGEVACAADLMTIGREFNT